MTQEKANKVFETSLGQQISMFHATSDDSVFIRLSEAHDHCRDVLNEGDDVKKHNITTWFLHDYPAVDYKKLMANNPTEYTRLTNSLGQEIVLYEHPIQGDAWPVIAACHEMEKAGDTGFYDTYDMTAEDREYEPWFDGDGLLWIGDFKPKTT